MRRVQALLVNLVVIVSGCSTVHLSVVDPADTLREFRQDIISSKIGELGENIVVRRFTRFAVGEGEAAAAATEQA